MFFLTQFGTQRQDEENEKKQRKEGGEREREGQERKGSNRKARRVITLCDAFRYLLSLQVPESVYQTLKVVAGSPLGEVVRGGESERGRNPTGLEERPPPLWLLFVTFWLPKMV